jgi:2-polyprenyl-6-methoxyphenol hydroxylase-like FAD-dependent oxidoreductase
LLEWYLRERLFEADNFFLKDNCKVESLLHSNDAITGVAIQNKNANRIDSLNADLVVDASGRDSRLPNWLENSGYNTVPQSKVNSFLGYASRWYKIPNGFPNQGIIINSTPSINRRSGVLYPVEGKHWIVTLGGFEGDYPTADETEFLAFAKTLRDPKIYEAISSAEPISPIRCYRRTENCWHHYEALSAMPEGIVAVGDAVCTFNPIYGQGMTVAALGAKTLDNCLNRMASSEKGFSLRFQRQLAKLVKTPWLMATGEDFRWPSATGKRPGWFSQKVQSYFDRITQLATHDTKVLQDFIEVAHLRKSPMNLFTPSILWKVGTQFQMKQSKG